MGYKNQTITLEFPEISEDDDPITVTIRNPKTLPGSFFEDDLEPVAPAFQEPDVPGESPEDAQARNERNQTRLNKQMARMVKAQTEASMGMYARLITAWHAYDEDGQLLGPVTSDSVRKLPQIVLTNVAKRLSEALNPQ